MDNGEPRFEVDVVALGPGWAFIRSRQQSPQLEALPLFLHQALVDWLREHPTYRVRATLPIVSQGQLCAIHVWFDPT